MDQLKSLSTSITGAVKGTLKNSMANVGFGGGNSDTALLQACDEVINERAPRPWDKTTISQVIGAVRSSSEDVQFQGLSAMVLLSQDDQNKLLIGEAGGVPPLLEACNLQNAKAQYAAARCVWNLATIEPNRFAIVNSGGLEAVSRVLLAQASANQYAGLRILFHLCESPELHKAVLKTQLPYSVTKLIASPVDQVSYMSASTMSYLAETEPEHPSLVNESFIGSLANITREGSNKTKVAGLTLVRSLAANHETVKKLASSGVIEALHEAIQSPDESLNYIAMSTLCKIPYLVENQLGRFIPSVITHMGSDRSSVVGAAANFIRTYIHNEDMRTAIIKKNDYLPFINALKSDDAFVQSAGALALNAIVKVPEAASAYVAQGGIASLAALLHQDETAQTSAVSILWPLTFTPAHHESIRQLCLADLKKIAKKHSDDSTKYLACLVLSSVFVRSMEPGEDKENSGAVKDFLSANDFKTAHLAYELTREDAAGINTFFDTTHEQGQMLAVWSFAYISKRTPQVFLEADGYDGLDHFATAGALDVAHVATQVLNEMDLSESLTPQDAGAMLDFFIGDIKEELGNVEALGKKRDQAERDLKVNYKKRENIDKLRLFEPHSFVSSEVNAKLAVAARQRQKIDSVHNDLVNQLDEIDPLLPSLQKEIDVFKTLYAKEEDKTKINALRSQIAELALQIAEVAKKIDGETSVKEGYEGERRTLVAKLSTRDQLEKERVGVVAELQDVQYQIDNFDTVMQEMDREGSGIADQQAETQAKLDELREKQDNLLKQIQHVNDEIKDWNRKLGDYESLRSTIVRFKALRKEVKDKYGDELNELVEFHELLGGLMTSGYAKLRALSGEETPHDSGNALSKESVHDLLDFGSKAEVALDERVSELFSELSDGKLTTERKLKELQDELKTLENLIDYTQVDLARVIDKSSVASLRKGQMPTRDQLELRKKQVTDDLHRIDKERDALKTVSTDIDALNEKIEEQAKIVGHDQAHKRRIEAEMNELERQRHSIELALGTDLNKFAEAFSRFKKSRAALQAKLRPLLANIAQWKELFPVEKRLTLEAWTSFMSIARDIQVVVDGLSNAKADTLFVNEQS
eukprot:c9003_g1_i1.p1 GENE.c9003_g1_i1~~c9003_g1_i1.p1  ORF type:complete len:1099 (+),score=269.81 c9003_g1_i1:51-3347(+)